MIYRTSLVQNIQDDILGSVLRNVGGMPFDVPLKMKFKIMLDDPVKQQQSNIMFRR